MLFSVLSFERARLMFASLDCISKVLLCTHYDKASIYTHLIYSTLKFNTVSILFPQNKSYIVKHALNVIVKKNRVNSPRLGDRGIHKWPLGSRKVDSAVSVGLYSGRGVEAWDQL